MDVGQPVSSHRGTSNHQPRAYIAASHLLLFRSRRSLLVLSLGSASRYLHWLSIAPLNMSFINTDTDSSSAVSRISIPSRHRIYPRRGHDDHYIMGSQDALPLRPRKVVKPQQTQQEAIDEFWAKFTTKAPGKGELPLFKD